MCENKEEHTLWYYEKLQVLRLQNEQLAREKKNKQCVDVWIGRLSKIPKIPRFILVYPVAFIFGLAFMLCAIVYDLFDGLRYTYRELKGDMSILLKDTFVNSPKSIWNMEKRKKARGEHE